MNKRTLTALRGSIKKWEAIVDGVGEDSGVKNCPLCAMYLETNYALAQNPCFGCPVHAATGKRYCDDTPYDAWLAAHGEAENQEWPYRIRDDDTAIAAVLELEWLRSLLPGAK